MILNFFGVLLEIKLLKRGKLLNFEFIKVSWLTMEKCLSDELNNKMTNLKSSISEHAIEQVQKKTRRLFMFGESLPRWTKCKTVWLNLKERS